MVKWNRRRGVANHNKVVKEGQEVVPGGFDLMPEVREMLEWQIRPENASFEGWTLLGTRLGLLYWIDRKWLEEHAGLIFDLRQIDMDKTKAYGWAAWNGFMTWGQPHIEFYRMLKWQFAFAVEQSAKVKLGKGGREEPMRKLGEQLMVLYGRGQLGLDEDGGILKKFLAEAVPEARARAMQFVGWTVFREKDLPSDVIQRFQDLWDWFWPNAGRASVGESGGKELFGLWFAAGQFDKAWSIRQLHAFVQVVGVAEPDDQIVKRLAEIAETDIVRAVEIIGMMERADAEGDGWYYQLWGDSLTKILELAMKAGGAARETAEQVIDRLGRRGLVDVGKLLEV